MERHAEELGIRVFGGAIPPISFFLWAGWSVWSSSSDKRFVISGRCCCCSFVATRTERLCHFYCHFLENLCANSILLRADGNTWAGIILRQAKWGWVSPRLPLDTLRRISNLNWIKLVFIYLFNKMYGRLECSRNWCMKYIFYYLI